MSGSGNLPDPNIVIQDGFGHTQLHRAIRAKNKPLIFSLISLNKFDYTKQDALKHTVLWMAASEMVDAEVVAALVKAGASIDDPQRGEIKANLDRAKKNDGSKAQQVNIIKQILQI